MSLLHAAILGIVEGLTEFLPVSSTGHLMLAGRLLGLGQTEFMKTFEIAIQLGAILAVVVLEWRTIFRDWNALKRVAVAFLPTGVIGFVLYKVIKGTLLGNDAIVPWALLIGGVVIIVFETWYARRRGPVPAATNVATSLSAVTYRQALLIGVAQSVAVVPGVSRSAASVLAALALGVDRVTAVRFSFLLAIPTMAAATGYDLLKSGAQFGRGDVAALAVGTAVSFVVALAAVKFLLAFVKTRTFIPFGIYRIAVALAFWAVAAQFPVTSTIAAPAAPEVVSAAAAAERAPAVPPRWHLPLASDRPRRITLLAAGDIMLSRDVGAAIRRKKDTGWPFATLAGQIAAADIAFANLETPVTPGRAVLTDEMRFRSDPAALDGLAGAGFDVVSLANNHVPDYGQKGIADTVAELDARHIAHAGAGMNDAAAHAPAVIEREGVRFAFLAYNDDDVVPDSYGAGTTHGGTAFMDATRAAADIASARAAADVVLVSMHSGREYVFVPNARQTSFAHAVIDAGADAVLGGHPHVVQSFEWYKGKPIFYSLGNFVFDQMWSDTTRDGAVALLTFDGSRLTAVDAAAVRIFDYGQPRPADDPHANNALARLGTSAVSLPAWHWDAPVSPAEPVPAP